MRFITVRKNRTEVETGNSADLVLLEVTTSDPLSRNERDQAQAVMSIEEAIQVVTGLSQAIEVALVHRADAATRVRL